MLAVSCQNGPTRHAYTWQIGPFWQDTFDVSFLMKYRFIWGSNHETLSERKQ